MLGTLIQKAAVEVSTGLPTGGGNGGIPGAVVLEDAARAILKSDDAYAPFVILLLGVVALLGYLLWKQANKRDALLERVVVVAEAYKNTTTSNTTALESMKGALSASTQAVHDLAREAEGEAREGRHGLAQIMMVVTNNAELIRAQANVVSAQNERINRLLERTGAS